MKNVFEYFGPVTTGDSARCGDDADQDGAVFIGDKDVVGELQHLNGREAVVTVSARLNGQDDQTDELEGKIDTGLGWGYSEYTPMESDYFKVGEQDLVDTLMRYRNKDVHVKISVKDFPPESAV